MALYDGHLVTYLLLCDYESRVGPLPFDLKGWFRDRPSVSLAGASDEAFKTYLEGPVYFFGWKAGMYRLYLSLSGEGLAIEVGSLGGQAPLPIPNRLKLTEHFSAFIENAPPPAPFSQFKCCLPLDPYV